MSGGPTTTPAGREHHAELARLIMRLADGETTEATVHIEAKALELADVLVGALERAEQERDDWRDVAERKAFALLAAETRIDHIRPILDEEWSALMAEHSVVDEARKLCNTREAREMIHDLDRALERYDAAREAAMAVRGKEMET